MLEWRDVTNYSKYGSPMEPRAWELRSGPLTIWVGNNHVKHAPYWVMHCHALGINEYRLSVSVDASKEEAQQFSLLLAYAKLLELTKAMSELIGEQPDD